MSLMLSVIRGTTAIFRTDYATRAVTARCFSLSSYLLEYDDSASENPKEAIDPALDRSKKHSVETSIRYLASEAYKTTYGCDPVWKQYRRNHKGAIPPQKTRRTCIRNGVLSTGNPCPICRDEYLVLDYRNPELLKQFISEYNGAVLSYQKTGICRVKHQELLVSIARAKDVGGLTYDVPFREYDYSDWYKPEPKV